MNDENKPSVISLVGEQKPNEPVAIELRAYLALRDVGWKPPTSAYAVRGGVA